MSDFKEVEERLKRMVEEQQPDPELPQRAIALAEELYAERRRKKAVAKKRWKLGGAIAAACAVVFVAVFFPVYFSGRSGQPAVRYLADSDLESSVYNSVAELPSSIDRSFKYFPNAENTTLYCVKETQQPVIVAQKYSLIDETYFDFVTLEICLTKDEFNRFDNYKNFENKKEISGISVDYMITENDEDFNILAQCQSGNYRYYWNITSVQGEARLDYYIDYLFGE